MTRHNPHYNHLAGRRMDAEGPYLPVWLALAAVVVLVLGLGSLLWGLVSVVGS